MTAPVSHRFWRWFYDHAAFAYDAILRAGAWLHIGSEERVRREVIGRLRLDDGARVLDLGCGTAANREWIAGKAIYIGVDFSRGMLKRAKQNCFELGLPADFVQADLLALPFPSQSVDVSIAMGVVQHTADCHLVVSEMERVTSSPGKLIVIDEDIAEDRIAAAMDGAGISSTWGEYFCIVREK
jgi:demethylmenaquinone methyltransferase/2-methoxy-6-polyprenyl-1,4-benzoquinol methylase